MLSCQYLIHKVVLCLLLFHFTVFFIKMLHDTGHVLCTVTDTDKGRFHCRDNLPELIWGQNVSLLLGMYAVCPLKIAGLTRCRLGILKAAYDIQRGCFWRVALLTSWSKLSHHDYMTIETVAE